MLFPILPTPRELPKILKSYQIHPMWINNKSRQRFEPFFELESLWKLGSLLFFGAKVWAASEYISPIEQLEKYLASGCLKRNLAIKKRKWTWWLVGNVALVIWNWLEFNNVDLVTWPSDLGKLVKWIWQSEKIFSFSDPKPKCWVQIALPYIVRVWYNHELSLFAPWGHRFKFGLT